jgi:hypothetical protein
MLGKALRLGWWPLEKEPRNTNATGLSAKTSLRLERREVGPAIP